MTSRARSLTQLAAFGLAVTVGATGCINPVGSYTGSGVVGCPTHALEIDGLLEMTSPTTYAVTGETLTQRLNTTRAAAGKDAANRRIFYDFTFSPPKSVSLVGFLGGAVDFDD